MNKTKKTILTLLFISISCWGIPYLIFSGPRFPITKLPSNGDACIARFDEFAYDFPIQDSEKHLPMQPWEIESEIPNQFLAESDLINVALVIEDVGDQEIWVSLKEGARPIDFVTFIKYRTDTEVWTIVNQQEYEQFQHQIPFDQQIKPNEISELGWMDVKQDKRQIYWGITKGGSIYSYDPKTKTPEEHIGINEVNYYPHILLGQDENIYIQDHYDDGNQILKYNPNTQQLVHLNPVTDFNKKYPSVGFIDSGNNLWLSGAYGVIDSSGEGNIFHPNRAAYWLNFTYYADWRIYYLPKPFFESSDGRIWFRVDNHPDFPPARTGLVWLSPETFEACWFTSEFGNLIEDSNQHIWFAADGKLYRHEIKP